MATTVYRVTVPSAYRRTVTNLQTGKVARFSWDAGGDAFDVLERAAGLLGDDLSAAVVTYGGTLDDSHRWPVASFYVASHA